MSTLEKQVLTGWGRFPRPQCNVLRPRHEAELHPLAKTAPFIARGNGRAYGDSALNTDATIDMRVFNHFIAFNAETGTMTAEAGVLLADIIKVALPKGWFPAVTPGTKYVTLGGMIAADVHGKNHHKDGSFGNFIHWIDVMTPDGAVQRCSTSENPDLFSWTIGGMGLTGIILRACFALTPVKSGWIKQKTVAAQNLNAVIAAFEDTLDWTYSVAWIDCLAKGENLGRSLLMLGEHATPEDMTPKQTEKPFDIGHKRQLQMPIDAPQWLLNRWTMKLANTLYFHKGKKGGETLVDWDSYFYPLDSVLDWNRLYGRSGFAQFQCMIPLSHARQGLQKLLEATSNAGQGSFLAVLKRFGKQQSRFSFPDEGYTLALDFPVNTKTLALLEELDHITVDHGGRFYLAKDSRMKKRIFESSDPRIEEFKAMRANTGSVETLHSLQSERLGL